MNKPSPTAESIRALHRRRRASTEQSLRRPARTAAVLASSALSRDPAHSGDCCSTVAEPPRRCKKLRPTRSGPDDISPLSSAIAEWLQFGFVFFATWIMSRIEDRSVFDYGLARTPRRLHWLLIGALLGLIFQSLLIVILWSTHHLVFAGVLLRPLSAVGYGLMWAIALSRRRLLRGVSLPRLSAVRPDRLPGGTRPLCLARPAATLRQSASGARPCSSRSASASCTGLESWRVAHRPCSAPVVRA